MSCCRAHATHTGSDPRFADDDFTNAALCEHRAHAAHKHKTAVVLSFIGGLLLLRVAKRHGCCGGCPAA